MTTIAGLPAHVLLVHAIVVLAPLLAALEILCALWTAARRRLVWLNLALAVAVMVLTPLTISAGEWLYDQRAKPSAILHTHQERGEWMIYFAVGLLIVAIVQVVQHRKESRSQEPRQKLAAIGAVLAILVGVSSIVVVVLIGDSGAHSVWGARQ
ncbi:hypothetical protein DVS77_13395 [Mycolicibacterium moriokaense]|nr:hypothetical protein DVS77_13395 [Mycolicibacterium moriokaense]